MNSTVQGDSARAWLPGHNLSQLAHGRQDRRVGLRDARLLGLDVISRVLSDAPTTLTAGARPGGLRFALNRGGALSRLIE